MTIITGKENIDKFRLVTLKHALKLEILGMKRRGKSAYAIIKAEFDLTGGKKKVFNDFCKLIEQEV